MTGYIIAAALAGCLALSGALYVLHGKNVALHQRIAAKTLAADACTARIKNLQEDIESDAEIDNMPDLNGAPDRWLRLVPVPGP